MKFSMLWRTRLIGVLFIVLLLVLWEVVAVAKLLPAMSFPRMSLILETLWGLIASGELFAELKPSMIRMFAGYLAGSALGVLVGLMMGNFRFFYNLLEPITEFLRPIPSPAYIPIVILFLGIDDEMKVFMIAFASFFPVLLNTYSGVRSVDPVQLQTARTFGVSGGQLLWQVVLPASAPYIFTGLRIGVGLSWLAIVAAEMLIGGVGIGFFIWDAWNSSRLPDIVVALVYIGLVGFVLDRMVGFLGNLATRGTAAS